MKKTNVPGSQSFGQKLLQFIRNNTVPIMFILICAYCIPQAGFSWSYLLNEVMTRLGRNAFLILSLLIPVMAGMGMNFGMTLDEILSACPAMTSSDKPTFAYLNAILEGMRMEGGVQEAIKSAALTEELAREIYSRAGLKGAPGRREKEAVSTWTVSWHMQPEAVLLAAERSAGYSHPFDRTRRLIEQLHEKGVTTLQQARKAIEELEKQPAAEGGKKQQSSYFMNYGQRKYSDEDLKSIGITLLEDEEDKK